MLHAWKTLRAQQHSQRRRRAAALHTAIAGCQLNALHMRADVDAAVAVFGSPTVCESLRVSRTPSPALFTSMLVFVCVCGRCAHNENEVFVRH